MTRGVRANLTESENASRFVKKNGKWYGSVRLWYWGSYDNGGGNRSSTWWRRDNTSSAQISTTFGPFVLSAVALSITSSVLRLKPLHTSRCANFQVASCCASPGGAVRAACVRALTSYCSFEMYLINAQQLFTGMYDSNRHQHIRGYCIKERMKDTERGRETYSDSDRLRE